MDKLMHNYQRIWLGGLIFIFAVCLPVVVGCENSGKRVIYGKVTYGGQPVEFGQVCFVPIEGTKGPLNAAMIIDGQYRIEARGGVPAGIYRVEVAAQNKTGRQRQVRGEMEDITVQMGPAEYARKDSPLRFEVGGDTGDQYDIDIPAK